ncbi:unnamed protein product [Rotaria socialis]
MQLSITVNYPSTISKSFVISIIENRTMIQMNPTGMQNSAHVVASIAPGQDTKTHPVCDFAEQDEKTKIEDEDWNENCGKCGREDIRSTILTEPIGSRMLNYLNKRVLCQECFNNISRECQQYDEAFESPLNLEKEGFQSRKRSKSIDEFRIDDDKRRDCSAGLNRSPASATESEEYDYEFESYYAQLSNVNVANTTEPKQKKTYPVLWLEHCENVNADYHMNYKQKIRENKFTLETFTTDILCENYLQSDTSGMCFLIVDASSGKTFLEKQIETAKGKIRLHNHSKLTAIYVYAPVTNMKIVDDEAPTMNNRNIIHETLIETSEVLPNPIRFSPSVMTVHNHTTSVVDHPVASQRSESTPPQSIARDTVNLESPPLLEQSEVDTSPKNVCSRFASFWKKCCSCRRSSNIMVLNIDEASPLLTRDSNTVIQERRIPTQNELSASSDMQSDQATDNSTDESLVQLNDNDWTKNFSKASIPNYKSLIRGVFINFDDLLAQICQDQIVVKEGIDNLLKLSVIKCDEASVQSSKRGNFIWFQIFIEALTRMKDDRDVAKTELLDLCHLVFKDDASTLRDLQNFERDYSAHNAVYWYTLGKCFYRLINKALRFHIYDTIIAFRLLINDIVKQLKEEQGQNDLFAFTSTIRVFRGQWTRMQEFKELSNSIDNLVVVNSFLSATLNDTTAQHFIYGAQINETETPVLMIIHIDNTLATGTYADISSLSAFPDEKEILFTAGCVFRIKNVYKNPGDQLSTIELALSSQDDSELRETYNYIRDGLAKEIDFNGLGEVLFKMNELKSSEKCHKRALEMPSTNDLQRLRSFDGLAHLNGEFGNHETALKIHKQVLNKRIHHLSPNDKLVGKSHVYVGIEYYHLKQLDKALFHYEKALQIYNECYPANHPVYFQFANNVAVVYAAKIEYGKARIHLEKADEILRAANVPETHPDTATILSNIGVVFSHLNDADNALSFQQRAFDIRQRSLPAEHLDMALSNQNLAILHESRNDYQLALLYYKEALRIKLSCLTQKSPEYLRTWEYYKDLCQKIQDVSMHYLNNWRSFPER